MHAKLVDDHEGTKRRLEEDILAHKNEEQDLRKRNYGLEKQKEKVAMDAAKFKAQLQESVVREIPISALAWFEGLFFVQETIKLKEMENDELKKQIAEVLRGVLV